MSQETGDRFDHFQSGLQNFVQCTIEQIGARSGHGPHPQPEFDASPCENKGLDCDSKSSDARGTDRRYRECKCSSGSLKPFQSNRSSRFKFIVHAS